MASLLMGAVCIFNTGMILLKSPLNKPRFFIICLKSFMNMNRDEVCRKLEYYVSRDKAAHWSRQLVEDMSAISFPLQQSSFTPDGFWVQHGIIPQAEYELPQNQFNQDSGTDSESMEGSFLTCGNLLRLAQAAQIGRLHLPSQWPMCFKGRLLGREHLDCLNEVWWLKFWRGIRSVSHAPKECGTDKDFDWRLQIQDGLADCTINLEVKRRTGNINRQFKRGKPNASSRQIACKFGPVPANTANVAALTIYHPISEDTVSDLSDWLNRQENVHGMVIWTEGNLGTQPLRTMFKQSHRWAEFLVSPPEPEDLKVAGNAWGTLCNQDQVPEFLEQITKHNR